MFGRPGPAPPTSPLPVRGGDLLLILIVVLASARLLAGVLVAVLPRLGIGGTLSMVVILLLLQTAIILGMLWAVVIRKYRLAWSDLGLRPAAPAWYRWALGVAVLLLPVVALINGVLIPEVSGQPVQNPQVYAIAPVGFSWPALITMVALAGVVAPFGEELAFRGLLFPWLRDRLGLAAATLLSALCFALLHGVLVLVPALTAVGVALALLYQRCGSLWPVIVAHGAFNSIMIVMLYTLLAAGVELP